MSTYFVKNADQIINDLIAYITSKTTKVTDFTPGSVIKSFCEGVGISLEEFYVSVYLGFIRALKQIPATVFDFSRKTGVRATTTAVFSRGTVAVTDILIPIGSRVSTSSGLSFLTTEIGYILTGNTDSDPISIRAEDVGKVYNVPADSITILSSTINGVETVNNDNAAVNGVDTESENSYQLRFQQYIEGLARSNIAGLISGCLSVEGITSVSVVELFPPVSNVNVRLYVDDGSSSGISDALKTEVQNIIDGDGTEENLGYRAGGVNAVVLKPTTLVINITATIKAVRGTNLTQLETNINTSIVSYVNNLRVGRDVIQKQLEKAITTVYGVYDIDSITPNSNTTVNDEYVARIGTIALTFVEVDPS